MSLHVRSGLRRLGGTVERSSAVSGRRSTADAASRRQPCHPRAAARLSLQVRSDPPDEFGGSYVSECRPGGTYGALEIVNNAAAHSDRRVFFRLNQLRAARACKPRRVHASTGAARWYSHIFFSLDHLRSQRVCPNRHERDHSPAGFLFSRASPGAHRPPRPNEAVVAARPTSLRRVLLRRSNAGLTVI